MKKKIALVITLLIIICCVAFAFVGCNNETSAIINGVDGCKNVVIDSNAKTITLEVDCLVDNLALSKFKVNKGITVKAYYDESKSRAIENGLPLEFGSNVYYVEAIGKNSSNMYKITIIRERPSASVDETKTVKSIEVAQAKNTYYVGESFSQGVLKVNYTDGSSALVLLTSNMVSGFSTSSKGEITVTVKLGEATATYTITIIELSIPQYPQVTPAQLDANVFAEAICKWYATICSYGNREYTQEEYDYFYQLAKSEYYDIFCTISERFARSGISTELFLNIDKYIYPILNDIQGIVNDISEIESIRYEADGVGYFNNTNKIMEACLNVERLKRMGENAKALLGIIKPEYIANFVYNEFDGLIGDFDSVEYNFNFGALAIAAENAGLNEIAQLLKDKERQFADSKVIGAFADYNSSAFIVDRVIIALDAILGCDFDAISSAILCITDISTMKSEDLSELLSGKGKYSYRDIIANANTVGDFVIKLVDNVYDKPIVKAILNSVVSKILAISGLGVSYEDNFQVYANFDLYKALGLLLKDLTVEDITNIYMDFNDWQVAVNNEKSEKECNVKFATMVARVAKLVGKALENVGDRDDVIKTVYTLINGFMSSHEVIFNQSAMISIIDKAANIDDPTEMTEQQALEIANLVESCLNPNKSYETLLSAAMIYPIKSGTTKSDFIKLLSSDFARRYYDEENEEITEEILKVEDANITGFDSSSDGYKTATLSWGALTAKVGYFVYSANTPKQMGIDWTNTYISTYRRYYNKDAEVSLEDLLQHVDNDFYGYMDPTSLYEVKVYVQDCNNLRVVGFDTSKVGDGVAYIVGEHEIMGTQVFPFNYNIIGNEKTVKSYDLYSTNWSYDRYGYKIGDKFQGYLQVNYNDNTSERLEIDERNLSYDFTTTGYKTVTYTYQGTKYTCKVRVYSDKYAREINYFDIWYSYSYLKDSSQEYVFRNSTIRFNAIDSLDISGMTVSEARKALKSVSADYDITIKGFDTGELGNHNLTITITKSGKTIISKGIPYSVYDGINNWGITIYVSNSNTDVTDINDLQIHHITTYSGIYLSDWTELLKYGEFKYDDDYGRLVFTYTNGNVTYVYIQQA